MASPHLERGRHGDPPRTQRQDYGLVLLQLLWRMRLDLLLYGLICLMAARLPSLPGDWTLNPMGLSVFGIAVSVFIAFRNTQAIGRWWEARSLWGAMVNHSRKWRDTLLAHVAPERMATSRGRCLVEVQVAQVWLLNFELRNFWRSDLRRGIEALLADLDLPLQLDLQELCRHRARMVQELFRDGWIDAWGRHQLVDVANQCLDAIGGLQRIRNTPIPASYDVFVRLISWLYGLQLLLSFQRDQRYGMGLLLFLGFLVAERIGAYVEGPFDRDGSCFSLPLNSLCSGISRDLMERPLDLGSFRASADPARWD
ncbi:MAG: bestrophin family ion channel [Prochlorococcaceae cyanobacterium]|jgi:putative membrane protein